MTVDTFQPWEKKETYRSKGELGLANLPHLFGDEDEFAAVVCETEKQLAKEDKRWTWKDVTSVFPMADAWAHKPVLRPRSHIHRHEYIISAPAEDVEKALVYAIDQFEIMRCIAVERNEQASNPTSSQGIPYTNVWFAVIRKDSPGLLHKQTTMIEVDSVEQGMHTAFQDDFNDGLRVQSPGPLVHFTIVKSANEPNKCGLLYQIHHAIFDMTSLSLFLDNVEDALNGQTTQTAPMSYGPYAFWRYTLPWTQQGQDNVAYHVKRLSGISQGAKGAQWPPRRAKHWLRGNDEGCDRTERKPLGPTGSTQKGLYHDCFAVHIPGIRELRSQHSLSPAKVVKGAQILFNVWKTGSREAVFAGAEGGRMVKGTIPESLNIRQVPGQVAEASLTRFKVDSWEETALDFLQRVQQDQINLSAHTPVHQKHLASALPKEDQEYLAELGGRQVFNWAPKVPNERKKIRLTKFEGRSDIGISWVFQMSTKEAEEDVLVLEASWDNCQMTFDEISLASRQLLSAAKWLANPDNTHKPIRECIFDPSISYDYHV